MWRGSWVVLCTYRWSNLCGENARSRRECKADIRQRWSSLDIEMTTGAKGDRAGDGLRHHTRGERQEGGAAGYDTRCLMARPEDEEATN